MFFLFSFSVQTWKCTSKNFPFIFITYTSKSFYFSAFIKTSLQSMHITLISFVARKLFPHERHLYFLVLHLGFLGCILFLSVSPSPPPFPGKTVMSMIPSLLISMGFFIPCSFSTFLNASPGSVILQPMYCPCDIIKPLFSASSLNFLLWYTSFFLCYVDSY